MWAEGEGPETPGLGGKRWQGRWGGSAQPPTPQSCSWLRGAAHLDSHPLSQPVSPVTWAESSWLPSFPEPELWAVLGALPCKDTGWMLGLGDTSSVQGWEPSQREQAVKNGTVPALQAQSPWAEKEASLRLHCLGAGTACSTQC